MFIKFIKSHGDTYTENTVECVNYEAYHHNDGDVTITTYPRHTNTDGVERQITKDKNRTGGFDACFMMNEAGKTIDKFEAPR